jgi:diphosphomevalonate decarboxylase
MKATAVAPSNIAFIKYWGRKDEVLRLPENGSISINLSNLQTTTTVEFNPDFKKDLVIINNEKEVHEGSRVIKHLDRIRKLAKINYKAKVVSKNNFPTGTGLSSSASGFAALTLAGTKAAGLSLSEKELSILARQGSGSACRSIPDGFVEWLDGNTNEASYAVSIFPPDYWDIVDVVAVVSINKKEVSTTEGQKLANSSPFFPVRLARIKDKIKLLKKYIQGKNFSLFGELVEQEALELHAIMITSTPSLIYWLPGTLKVMHAVKRWRQEGLQVYFTVNTGQDIHLICQKKDAEKVVNKAKEIPDVTQTIINYPSKGAY